VVKRAVERKTREIGRLEGDSGQGKMASEQTFEERREKRMWISG
jgi:hypothetical protein